MGKKPGATVEMNATAVSTPNPLANSTPRDIEVATVASVAVIANKIRRPSAVTYLDNKERVEGYVKCLKYSNFILLFLTLCMCGIGSYLIHSVGAFSNSLQTILVVLLMSSLVNILGILVSICGQRTVAHDIATELRKSHSSKNLGDGRDETLTKTDYDGRNTKGQMCILFGFYTAFIAGANIVICGLALAINAGGMDGLKSSILSSGSKAMSGNAVAALYPLLIVFTFVYMIVNAVGMYYSSAITTFYTILQSLLQVLCILYSIISLVLIFGSVYALCMNQFSGSSDLGIAPALYFTIAWGFTMFFVCIYGIIATKTESAKGLKIFGFCLFLMGVCLFGGVYLASQDANKAIDEKCASVVTIMSDRGWHELFKCNKYSGEAVRWDSNFQEHVTAVGTMGMYSFNESAVGEETYCDKSDPKSRTLFAWEFNVLGRRWDQGTVTNKGTKYIPTDETGKRVDWYGCLNSKCCQVLKSWIEANRSYFFAAAFGLFLLLILGLYVTIRVAKDVETSSKKMAHGKDLCIGITIGLLLVFGGVASIALATSVPISPQKSVNSIQKNKNISSDLPISSNETTTCHSTTALAGDGTCVSCFNKILDGDEAGIDCGGSCRARCQSGQKCASALPANRSDCDAGLLCNGIGICNEPTPMDLCMNGMMDAGESCIDGGYACYNHTGVLCDNGKTCKIDDDCMSHSCYPENGGQHICVSCEDGIKTGRETDVDCGGGSCQRCEDGKKGTSSNDCMSGYLDTTSKNCASCNDGVVSGDKTDTNCGSTLRNALGVPLTSSMNCPKCVDAKTCASNSDCKSNSCVDTKCVSCTNGVKDGTETAADCGGSCSTKCAIDKGCSSGADCETGFCNTAVEPKVCRIAVDTDYCAAGGVGWTKKSPEISETDVDCGGPGCRRLGNLCALNKLCLIHEDCQSTATGGGLCVRDPKISNSPKKCVSCSDTTKNGDETDVDCGGQFCKKCDDLKVCDNSNDCSSGRCFDNICISCTDNKMNGNETSVDCGGGGQCSPCGATGNIGTGSCLRNDDCLSGRCESNMCVSCFNNIKDSNEGDVDCGGKCAKKCVNGKTCNTASDCDISYCDRTCKDPPAQVHCTNGVLDAQDYGETDIDCGGLRCNALIDDEGKGHQCAIGKKCKTEQDCDSGLCTAAWSSETLSTSLTCSGCSDGLMNGRESDVDCGGVEDVLDTNRGGSTYDQGGYGTGDGTDEIYSVLGSDMTIQTAPGVFVDSSDVTMGVTGQFGASCSRCNATQKCRVNSDCKSAMCYPTRDSNVLQGLYRLKENHFEMFSSFSSNDLYPSVGSDRYVKQIHVAVHAFGSDYVANYGTVEEMQDEYCNMYAGTSTSSGIDPMSELGNEYGIGNSGSGSYCKHWMTPAICQGSDVRCDVRELEPAALECRSCSDNVQNGDETCVDGGGDMCRSSSRCKDAGRCKLGSDCDSGRCHHTEEGDNVRLECLPPMVTQGYDDPGYPDEYRGWYDIQGCGQCNDYCRWVGGSGSGGNPNDSVRFGSSWWSCRQAGTSSLYSNFDTPDDDNYQGEWSSTYTKCDGQGASSTENVGGYGYGDDGAVALLSPLQIGFGTCVSCSNGMVDGSESGIDCGGGFCSRCRNGQTCDADNDCLSTKCDVEEHICRNFTSSELCNNDVLDLKTRESSIDCGGECSPCLDGKACAHDGDCESNTCYNDICVSCDNDKKDGRETDKDCGGQNFFLLVGNICGVGSGGQCNVACSRCCNDMLSPADCNRCVHDNRVECTDHKTGGWDGCPACPDKKICITDHDCASEMCESGLCVSCNDQIKNTHEACVDGGGSICRERCSNGETCKIPSDCSSGLCFGTNPNKKCVACDNEYRDGDETCGDGGGPTCSRRCNKDEGCKVGSDCATGYCNMEAPAVDSDGFGKCRLAKPSEFCANSVKELAKGETDTDCGGPCVVIGKACDNAKVCSRDSDCKSSNCHNKICVSCNSNTKDGTETDTDCGGINLGGAAELRFFPSTVSGNIASSGIIQTAALVAPSSSRSLSNYNGCPACALTKLCLRHDDCNDFCDLGVGAATPSRCVSCSDNLKQITLGETDVDCGGSICPKRCLTATTTTTAQACVIDTDCESNDCLSLKCVSCTNNVKDGTETDIDCGGNHCSVRCSKTKTCASHKDCITGWCNPSNVADPNTCQEMPAVVHCADTTTNEGESDVDCGYVCSSEGKLCKAQAVAPATVAAAQACVEDRDCKSNSCHNSICVSCGNGVKDGTEVDVDCGTEGCALCADTKICKADIHCDSGSCSKNDGTAGTCVSCNDGIKNNGESDKDCGGTSCNKCIDLQTCTANSDCRSGFCLNRGTANDNICVTKAPAQLDITPSNGISFVANDDSTTETKSCRIVTSGISIRPSISNTTGWRFCQLKATVTVDGGATLNYKNLQESPFGILTQSTSASSKYIGTPPQIEEFLRRQLRFCPSCLPRAYTMRIALTTYGSDTLSPCPTDQTIEHYITADTAAMQNIEMTVRDAQCVTNGTCSAGASLLSGAQIHVNAGACYQESILTDGRGRGVVNVPLSRPRSPSPRFLNITISKAGYAPVTLTQDRFDGAIDLGNFYLVSKDAASLHPAPVLKGYVLDASNNGANPLFTTGTISCYRGYGVTSGAGALVGTSPVSAEGAFTFSGLNPGLYTIVGDYDGYVMNYRTTLWNDVEVQLLLSPVVPVGSMRIVLSWKPGRNVPEDLDLHVKFKVNGNGPLHALNVPSTKDAAAAADASPARRFLDAGWVNENKEDEDGYGYGDSGEEDVQDTEAIETLSGYGDAGVVDGVEVGSVFETEAVERECDVWDYSRACGGAVLEVSSRNNTAISGGESILLKELRQSVYTVFVRNYKSNRATEWSGAMLEIYDADGKRDTILLPSADIATNYEAGVVPAVNHNDTNAFRKSSGYARMACIGAIGGGSNGTGTEYVAISETQMCDNAAADSIVLATASGASACQSACDQSDLCQGYSMAGDECTHLKMAPEAVTTVATAAPTPGACWSKKIAEVGLYSIGRYSQYAVSALSQGECPPSNEKNLCKKMQKMSISGGANGTVAEIYDGTGSHYNYKNDQTCMWDVSSSESASLLSGQSRLSLKWNRFETEKWSTECEYDYVKVWDSSCSERTDENLLYKTCGCGTNDVLTNRPSGATCGVDVQARAPAVLTRGTAMCVEYVTDSDISLNGIAGRVTVVDDVFERKTKCREHKGCQECIADSDCGFCHSTGTCDAGNALGDFNAAASTCPRAMWSANDCACRDGSVIDVNVRQLTPSGEKYLITDGSGPHMNYHNNARCQWKLFAPDQISPGEAIVLSFKEFDVEEGWGCIFDGVKISWKDHTDTLKSKSLCKTGTDGNALDKIEITGSHGIDNPIEVSFTSDASVTFGGFTIQSEIVEQKRVLLDTTWSGCSCENTEWTHQGVSGAGCQDIPDGRAVCRVQGGSCTHHKPTSQNKSPWPPTGQLMKYYSMKGACTFPFMYRGAWHNDCINVDNGNVPWCTNLKVYPENPWYAQFLLKIPCDSGRSDFFEDLQHLDYCSSWRTDDTGSYYNDYSGSLANNPVLNAQYAVEDAVEWVLEWVARTTNGLSPRR